MAVLIADKHPDSHCMDHLSPFDLLIAYFVFHMGCMGQLNANWFEKHILKNRLNQLKNRF